MEGRGSCKVKRCLGETRLSSVETSLLADACVLGMDMEGWGRADSEWTDRWMVYCGLCDGICVMGLCYRVCEWWSGKNWVRWENVGEMDMKVGENWRSWDAEGVMQEERWWRGGGEGGE